jgi:GT2 family glycosyltransferase
MHVVISDNGSRSTSIELLRGWAATYEKDRQPTKISGISSLAILENGINLGFTGANTVGIHYSLSHGADYVLFLNNDTVVTPTFLSKMVSVAQKDSRIGLLGCKTLLGGNDMSNSPRIIWSLGGYGYRFGNPMNLGSNKPDRTDWQGVIENDLICGCCMLIRKEAIEQCGVQDDDLFFAIDDVEYSLRISRAGWRNVLVLDAEITHYGSKSVEGRIGLQLYYLFRNTYYFRNKYFPWYKNIIFFAHHISRYFVIGGLGRIILGKSRANVGMLLGIKDFLLRKLGECPHKSLLIKK